MDEGAATLYSCSIGKQTRSDYTADAGEEYLNVYRFLTGSVYLGCDMEVRIYDRDLNFKGVIENHTSLIWTRNITNREISRSTPRSQNKTFAYWQKETLFPNVAAAKRE